MLISVGITGIILLLSWLTLRNRTGQNRIVQSMSWMFNASTATATVIVSYFALVVGIMTVMSIFLFLGLLLNWGWLISGSILLFGLILMAITIIVDTPVSAMTKALGKLREQITVLTQSGALTTSPTSINQAIASMPDGEAKEKLTASLQKASGWLEWITSLFNPAMARGIATNVAQLTLGNAEEALKDVGRGLATVKTILLWMGILAFMSFFIPDAASGKWLVIALFGIGILIRIATQQGKVFTEKHKLPDIYWTGFKLVRWGVRAAVVAICLAPVTPLGSHGARFIRPWAIALDRYLTVQSKETPKDQLGQRYDQMIYVTLGSGIGYSTHGWLFGFGNPVNLTSGEVLWLSDKEETVLDDQGVQWSFFYRQMSSQLRLEASHGVWYPESETTPLKLETRAVVLPKGMRFRDDVNNVPGDVVAKTKKQYACEMSSITKIYDGDEYKLCQLVLGNQPYMIWVMADDLGAAISVPASPTTQTTNAVMTSSTTPGGLMQVMPYQITLGVGDKYYNDQRTRPDLSCWIPLPHDLSSQEVVARWTNPATGKNYLRVRGPQWFNPTVIVHIWVDA